ncbi:unnamed protein product [Urochloa humidicola]
MGVRCGYDDGRVTSLDLSARSLESGGLEPAIFDLISLRKPRLVWTSIDKRVHRHNYTKCGATLSTE